jgi:hypothetical protein
LFHSCFSHFNSILHPAKVLLSLSTSDTSIDFHNASQNNTTKVLSELATHTKILERMDERAERHFTQAMRETNQEYNTQENRPDVEDKLDSLMASVGLLLQRSGQRPTPRELKGPCDQYMNVWETIEKDRLSQSALLSHKSSLSFVKCTCVASARKKRLERKLYWISTFWTESRAHSHDCPLSISSQRLVTVGLQIHACRGALGYLVEVSLEWSHRSLCPRVLARNIVSESSPAFHLVGLFGSALLSGPRKSENELQSTCSVMMKALLKLLRDKKSRVFDVTPYGWTLAHVCDFR